MEWEELKCWVRRKSFSVSLAYLAEILHINRPMLRHSPVYDDLCPDEELLKDGLGQDLEFSSNGNLVSVSSLPPKLRVLTIVMFHNLYTLSSTGYMNLRRALFLHDLISDVEIDICAHIFHVLRKTVLRTESRICVPLCCLISRILKLKGIYPTADESLCPKPSPINMRTFNASSEVNFISHQVLWWCRVDVSPDILVLNSWTDDTMWSSFSSRERELKYEPLWDVEVSGFALFRLWPMQT